MANKRIKELQRKQKLMQEMNMEKASRYVTKKNHRQALLEEEESKRRKFSEARVLSQTRIMQSQEKAFKGNRSTFYDIKMKQ